MHASNDPVLVDAILSELGVGPEHAVAGYDERLGALLADHLEIRTPSRALQTMVASRTQDAAAAARWAARPWPGRARGCTAKTCST